MQSPTEALFNERVAAFEQKYLPNHSEEVAYVKKTWLEPYKEKLVKAWVDQHMHFGNAVTSRVEGIHALLKSYLKTSSFDLFDVWRTIKHAVENQLSELQSIQARQQTRKPTEHLGAGLFSALHGWISHEAMKKVEEQRKLLDKKDPFSSPLCTGTFTRSHGLPCVHTIKALQERNQVLQMHDFHRQWHLKRSGTHPQPILEPNRVKTGTMNTKIAQSSTQREPSAFERLGKPAPPKCSRCHIVGHSRTSKSCPLRQEEVLLESSASHLAESLTTSTQMLAGWSQEAENALASQIRIPCSSVDQPIDVEEAQSQDTIVVGGTSPQPSRASGEPELPMPSQSTPLPSSTLPTSRKAQVLPYYAPEAVYQRYVAARAAWYKSQPAGSLKTNQAYRGAMGLPQRYSKETYAWCQDYKQMGRFCYLPQGGRREWAREEMMAYIDWDYEEIRRTDAQVQQQLGNNSKEKSRRGMAEIFREAEEDTRVQEARYSVA
ncbi:hypothetical protein MRS44_017502 [Fusarium solani]|uniref:uncharacterized protein n=1 Tax=Fusarium solani TaxID=169388 RepID=UPI0032C48E94|nr:hypothetical protein MRS44_017502 [Fusarium solani]